MARDRNALMPSLWLCDKKPQKYSASFSNGSLASPGLWKVMYASERLLRNSMCSGVSGR